MIGKTKIFCIKFADDVAIVAEEEKEMKRMVEELEKYTRENDLEINTRKTKMMRFRNGGGRNAKTEWVFNEEKIEEVKKIKYLGFQLSCCNSRNEQISTQANEARKAIKTVWGVMKRGKIENTRRKINLYESLIQSIALYGVELWEWSEKIERERIQGEFMKMIMGVSRNTPDYIWRREMARNKMARTTLKRVFKFIIRIERMDSERWTKICWEEIKRGGEK